MEATVFIAPPILITVGLLVVAFARRIQRRIVRVVTALNETEGEAIVATIRLVGVMWIGGGVWLLVTPN